MLSIHLRSCGWLLLLSVRFRLQQTLSSSSPSVFQCFRDIPHILYISQICHIENQYYTHGIYIYVKVKTKGIGMYFKAKNTNI